MATNKGETYSELGNIVCSPSDSLDDVPKFHHSYPLITSYSHIHNAHLSLPSSEATFCSANLHGNTGVTSSFSRTATAGRAGHEDFHIKGDMGTSRKISPCNKKHVCHELSRVEGNTYNIRLGHNQHVVYDRGKHDSHNIDVTLKLKQTHSHHETDKRSNRSHFAGIPLTESHSISKSAFSQFLEQIEPMVSPDKSLAAEYMKGNVQKIVEKVVEDLSAQYSLFAGSFVIPTGSVIEGTKIGFPNEMDFMCILPQLENEQYFCVIESKESEYSQDKKLQIRDASLLKSIYPNLDTSYLTASLFKNLVINCFKDVLLHSFPHWRHLSHCFKKYALTLHLFSNEYSSNISVDCCFAFTSKQTVTFDLLSIMEKVGGIPDRKEYRNMCLFELLPNEGVSLRTSSSEIEIAYLKSLGSENNILWIYRIAKYIVSTFFPRFFHSPCYLCELPFVPSYYIKTILFNMMEKYEDNRHWSAEKMDDRLVELFRLLEQQIDTTGKRFTVSPSKFLVEGNPLIIREHTSPRSDALIPPKQMLQYGDPGFNETDRFLSFLEHPPLIKDFSKFIDIKSIVREFNSLLHKLHTMPAKVHSN